MIIAYYPIHYGSDYLGYSIKSIYEHVDQIHILYTDKPSYGYSGALKNPDNIDKIRAASLHFGDPKNKLIWHQGHWSNEGQHRDTINSIAVKVNADMILAVDADEIWDAEVLEKSINAAYTTNVRYNLIRMLTFWRCFHKVAMDEMLPNRIILPKAPMGHNYMEGRVLHFGYARTIDNIEYKISIHGHKNEWRKEWIETFRNWPNSRDYDLHPTCKDVWNLFDYDKSTLPSYMRQHPYYDLAVI